MVDTSPLLQPWNRSDLQAYVSELQADDPRQIWRAQRDSGLAAGIDEVFHFLFDDNDFDSTAIGFTLFDAAEVRLIGNLKQALAAILDAVGDAGDDEFVSHPLWPEVRHAATAANTELARFTNGS